MINIQDRKGVAEEDTIDGAAFVYDPQQDRSKT